MPSGIQIISSAGILNIETYCTFSQFANMSVRCIWFISLLCPSVVSTDNRNGIIQVSERDQLHFTFSVVTWLKLNENTHILLGSFLCSCMYRQCRLVHTSMQMHTEALYRIGETTIQIRRSLIQGHTPEMAIAAQGWLTDRLTGWLAGWLADWRSDWLTS